MRAGCGGRDRYYFDRSAFSPVHGADPEDWIGDRERRVRDGPPPRYASSGSPEGLGMPNPVGFGKTCGLRQFEAPKSFERRENCPHLCSNTTTLSARQDTAKASNSFDKSIMMQTSGWKKRRMDEDCINDEEPVAVRKRALDACDAQPCDQFALVKSTGMPAPLSFPCSTARMLSPSLSALASHSHLTSPPHTVVCSKSMQRILSCWQWRMRAKVSRICARLVCH